MIHHDRPNLTPADMANMALAEVGITHNPCVLINDRPAWPHSEPDRLTIQKASMLVGLRVYGPDQPTKCVPHLRPGAPLCPGFTVADALLGRTCQDVTP